MKNTFLELRKKTDSQKNIIHAHVLPPEIPIITILNYYLSILLNIYRVRKR